MVIKVKTISTEVKSKRRKVNQNLLGAVAFVSSKAGTVCDRVTMYALSGKPENRFYFWDFAAASTFIRIWSGATRPPGNQSPKAESTCMSQSPGMGCLAGRLDSEVLQHPDVAAHQESINGQVATVRRSNCPRRLVGASKEVPSHFPNLMGLPMHVQVIERCALQRCTVDEESLSVR